MIIKKYINIYIIMNNTHKYFIWLVKHKINNKLYNYKIMLIIK